LIDQQELYPAENHKELDWQHKLEHSLPEFLYVLDEPSIGLHQSDNLKLINSLKNLRDLGNTVIVVEHDRETIENSDYIVDLGPAAGVHGGEVCISGETSELLDSKTQKD
jgi:Excinuclease ATPase subunit